MTRIKIKTIALLYLLFLQTIIGFFVFHVFMELKNEVQSLKKSLQLVQVELLKIDSNSSPSLISEKSMNLDFLLIGSGVVATLSVLAGFYCIIVFISETSLYKVFFLVDKKTNSFLNFFLKDERDSGKLNLLEGSQTIQDQLSLESTESASAAFDFFSQL